MGRQIARSGLIVQRERRAELPISRSKPSAQRDLLANWSSYATRSHGVLSAIAFSASLVHCSSVRSNTHFALLSGCGTSRRVSQSTKGAGSRNFASGVIITQLIDCEERRASQLLASRSYALITHTTDQQQQLVLDGRLQAATDKHQQSCKNRVRHETMLLVCHW